MAGAPSSWRLRHRSSGLLLVVLLSLSHHSGAARDDEAEEVTVTYLWPILLTSVPLSGPDGFESAEFGQQLAKVGLRKYKEYVNETLPKELELDTPFAEEFAVLDHSRVNVAFQRWQRLAFADHFEVPVHELTSSRATVPRLDGIEYKFPELYEHKLFDQFESHVETLARKYLKRVGYKAEEVPEDLRIFTWVEVFGAGDAMRPAPRTDGAFCAGKYFAVAEHGSIKFAFEDPRGINPPFGKTFNHDVFPGNLIFYPVWASYFITPNMKKKPVVTLSFLVYGPEGNARHWKHDKTAGYSSTDTKKA